jgi:predicted hydrocarbon binding protein
VSSKFQHASFQADPAQGTLRRTNGARLAVVPAEFLLALHLYLFERFAENAQDVLYRSGYEQGLQDMMLLNQELRDQYGSGSFDFWQMDEKFILDSWWGQLAQAGWGRCTFDLTAHSRGIAFVELEDSPVAAALGNTEHPICHFLAGLFAGAVSFYERAERHATELECRAAGADRCRFVVAGGGAVDSAEGWRQQGVAVAEIMRRLR